MTDISLNSSGVNKELMLIRDVETDLKDIQLEVGQFMK